DRALIYYNRIIQEPLIDISLRTQAELFAERAAAGKSFKTAANYYSDYQNARLVSDKWAVVQEFRRAYPTDSRFKEVLNDIAIKNFSEGRYAHRNNQFELALTYYNRIIGDPQIDATLRTQAELFAERAAAGKSFKTAANYYSDYQNARLVSDKWAVVQEFRRAYPTDSRFKEVLNDIAIKNFSEGRYAHRNNQFELALTYYNRIIEDPQ